MTSESGGRIGTRRRAQRLGGQARGCEAFCGSKGHGTSRESTSSVTSTSSIGRAIVTETVGRRFKSGVFIPSESLSLPRLESAVILGPAKGTEATVNSQGDRMSVRCQSGSGVSCPCLYRDLAE